ncbi:MAG: sialidase family protein, partial [candidate division WOR-3 bacterium]
GSVVYRRSTDFGSTWGSVVTLMTVTDPPDPPPHGDTIFEIGMGPSQTSLCANGNYVHAIWDIDSVWTYYINLGGGDTDTVERHHYWIYYARSTNAGVNWSSPVLLHNLDSVTYAPAVAAAGTYVYVVWVDHTPPKGTGNNNASIYFVRSPDGGKTFGQSKIVNDEYKNGDFIHDFPDVSVDESKNIFVFWVDDREGAYNIYSAVSKD